MDAVYAVVSVALLLGSFVRLAGPFRELVGGGVHTEPCSRCPRADTHSHWTAGWLRDWRSRPRPPLTAQDWLPWSGVLFPATFVVVLGIIAAARMIPGDDLSLPGVLLVVGGILTALLVVLHVGRPTAR